MVKGHLTGSGQLYGCSPVSSRFYGSIYFCLLFKLCMFFVYIIVEQLTLHQVREHHGLHGC